MSRTYGGVVNTERNLELEDAAKGYSDTADELTKRILALIPDHPEILTLDGPFKLFKVPGFTCDDLQPSFFQAGWALAKARKLYQEGSTP